MLMPFGKFKDKEVASCPHPYLTWVVNNVALHGQLQEEVCKELGIEIDDLRVIRNQVEALKQENMQLKAMLAGMQRHALGRPEPEIAGADPEFVRALKKIARSAPQPARPHTLRLFQ